MSNIEIKQSLTISDGTSENCDKQASTENAKTNPVEYFQSSELLYYFISPTTGYYNSSRATMPESGTDNDRLKGNIFAFSRRVVYKRSARFDSILKRKRNKEIRKLAKYKNDLKTLIETMLELSRKKKELVEKITILKDNIKHGLSKTPGNLNTNMNKSFKGTIILTRPNEVYRSHKDKKSFLEKDADEDPLQPITDDESNCTQMPIKHGDKSRRKYLMVKYNIRPSLQRKHKKYFTYIRLAYKSPKSHLKDSQDYGKSEAVNSTPPRSPSPGLFMGKDSIYPAELNELFHPNKCDLCHVTMNSDMNAHRHYISDSHDRRITNWCCWNYTKNGVEPPKGRKFITKVVYPSGYFCDLCKVKLPSSRHALQHFNGKRHRAVLLPIAPVSGIGYFNCRGDWIETGKIIDETTGKESAHVLVKTLTGIEQVVLYDASKTSSGIETRETCLNEAQFEGDLLKDKSDDLEHGCSEQKVGETVIFEQGNSLEEKHQVCIENTIEEPNISEEENFKDHHGEENKCNENTAEEHQGKRQVCNENTIEKPDNPVEENLFKETFEEHHGEGQIWSEITVKEPAVSKHENSFEKHRDNTVEELDIFKIVNSLKEDQSQEHGYAEVCSVDTVEDLVTSKDHSLVQEQSGRKPKLTVRNIQLMMDQQESRSLETTPIQFRPEYFGTNIFYDNMEYERFYSSTMSDSSASNFQNSPDHNPHQAEDIEMTTFYSQQSLQGMQTPKQAMDTLSCILCNIKATSKNQMFHHLKGSRHSKKMKLVGDTPLLKRPYVTIADSLLLEEPEDLSIYRTPSGSYYCDACKVHVSSPERISTHLASKRHYKVMRKKRNSNV